MEISWTFTGDEARMLYGLLTSLLVPFVVSYLKKVTWPPWAKVALAGFVSLAGAFLSEYAAGTLDGPVSIVMVAIGIFTAAQAHFATWFRATGAEDRLTQDAPSIERLRMLL